MKKIIRYVTEALLVLFLVGCGVDSTVTELINDKKGEKG